jgi:hypothetical protein
MIIPAGAVVLASLLGHQPAAQQTPAPRAPIDVAKLGPQVGQQIPGFTLNDQNGKSWTDRSILGPRGAMLVFFRSADW